MSIDDERLCVVNPLKLDVSNNPKITQINHMTKLVELTGCGSNCGINNQGIKWVNQQS